ncbi:MAG: hypothetical protein KIG70_00905 [Treponema sp.]|uniref:hypothetical protein n=1 Tax=Treponema sp. TaxID=166 RepID=UPI001D708883|nr:hypothetical protein [Treponema sp.]MBS7309728.1 hypothetical protein [Treponema sp.]
MRVNKKVLTIILTVFAVIFALFESNCRSTLVERTVDETTALELGLDKGDNVFQIYISEELKQALTQDHWIFIRLYQPYYDNPLCIENVLSKCIQFVDVNPDYSSHSAIGFSLDDGFYGLTSSNSGHNLYLESCTNSGDNEYMKKCNIYKSVEITYALKVTEEEYKKAKNLVESYYDDTRTCYNINQNVKIAWKAVGRKFFSPKDKQQFAAKPFATSEQTFCEDKYDFVCSSFVAYVLANSVESVHDFFVEKQIDSNYVMPSDLAYIPGVIKLFKTTWVDYNIGAKNVAQTYTCFATYYHDYVSSEK